MSVDEPLTGPAAGKWSTRNKTLREHNWLDLVAEEMGGGGRLRESEEHRITPEKAFGKGDIFMQNGWGWKGSSDLDMLNLNYGIYGLSK